ELLLAQRDDGRRLGYIWWLDLASHLALGQSRQPGHGRDGGAVGAKDAMATLTHDEVRFWCAFEVGVGKQRRPGVRIGAGEERVCETWRGQVGAYRGDADHGLGRRERLVGVRRHPEADERGAVTGT